MPSHAPDPSSRDDRLTLADLLEEDLLDGTLVAGRSGLGHEIGWCVPCLGQAGVVDSDLDQALVYAPASVVSGENGNSLVDGWADRGAAGVLLVPDGGGPPDLAAAAAAADRRGLPLHLLSSSVSYRRVHELTATKLVSQRAHVLEYANTVHRALGDIFARGAGLDALLHRMAQFSGATIIVVNRRGDVLGTGGSPPGAFVPELAATFAPYAEDCGPRPDAQQIEWDGRHWDAVLTRVVVSDRSVVLALVAPPGSEHRREQHAVVVHEGATLVASELLRRAAAAQAAERVRNDFVQGLLHARFADELELRGRAEHHGFALDGWSAVFVASAQPEAGLPMSRWDRALSRSLGVQDDAGTVLSTRVGTMLVVIRQWPTPPAGEAEVLRATARTIARAVDPDAMVAFGGLHEGARGVAAGYREARTTADLAVLTGKQGVLSHRELRVFAGIRAAANTSEGRAFAEEMLGPLRRAGASDLLEVVLAYVEEGGNVNATSRRLHLHRNTMLYKLDRASRELGLDVRDPQTQFMIWLAHHLHTLSVVLEAMDAELSPPA